MMQVHRARDERRIEQWFRETVDPRIISLNAISQASGAHSALFGTIASEEKMITSDAGTNKYELQIRKGTALK